MGIEMTKLRFSELSLLPAGVVSIVKSARAATAFPCLLAAIALLPFRARQRHVAVEAIPRQTPLRSLALFILVVLCSALTATANAQTDLPQLAQAINATMRQYHYNPGELDKPDYLRIEAATVELANTAADADAFLAGFNMLWRDGPFSHVVLRRNAQSIEEVASYIDTLRIGGGGARLEWSDDIAILTVRTMMGGDTIEEIEAAFAEIAARGASGLIIDLRANEGGAFAVRPLVEHVIDHPLDAGVFVSQLWATTMDRPPERSDIAELEPWQGWSVRSFWADTRSNPLTRIRFESAENAYPGPVYVLISEVTASAAEMAADALESSGRAVLIGEVTAGEMLSQTVFDLPGDFQLWLPVVDYRSLSHGRIEGNGVSPHIIVDADMAMARAVQLLGR